MRKSLLLKPAILVAVLFLGYCSNAQTIHRAWVLPQYQAGGENTDTANILVLDRLPVFGDTLKMWTQDSTLTVFHLMALRNGQMVDLPGDYQWGVINQRDKEFFELCQKYESSLWLTVNVITVKGKAVNTKMVYRVVLPPKKQAPK